MNELKIFLNLKKMYLEIRWLSWNEVLRNHNYNHCCPMGVGRDTRSLSTKREDSVRVWQEDSIYRSSREISGEVLMQTPWLQTYSPQNWEKINFCCLSLPVWASCHGSLSRLTKKESWENMEARVIELAETVDCFWTRTSDCCLEKFPLLCTYPAQNSMNAYWINLIELRVRGK